MMKSNNLEKDLEALRIRIVDKPVHEREHQINEDALREELEREINYSRPQQIVRGVDSISAIMRLRKGKNYSRLEECRALFVTTNSKLVRLARVYFSDGSGSVSPCLTDYALTNLLWLKRPTAAPDLPRKRIIADCYAATRPTEQLWRDYLQEIERLRQKGEVSPDEYLMLRHSTAAESALMDATMGQQEGFTQGTVPEVLERVRSNIEAKARAELGAERASKEGAESELKAERERDVRRRANVRSNAEKGARWLIRVLMAVALGLLVLASAYSFPWSLPSPSEVWWRYLLATAFVLLFLLSVANLVRGTTLVSICRRLEISLAHWIERKLLTLTGEE